MYIGKRSYSGSINNDSYMGSGVALKRAILKYGKQNFSKYIIEDFDTAQKAFEFERKIIKEVNAVLDPRYYNLVHGGPNGCEGRIGKLHPMFGKYHSSETKSKMSEAQQGSKNGFYGKSHSDEVKKILSMKCGRSGMENNFYGKTHSEDVKEKLSNYAKERTGDKNGFYGKNHSDETKNKISQKNKGKLKGVPKTKEQREKMSVSNKKRREIIVFGVKYSSITSASKECNIERHKLSKMAKDKNNNDVSFV